ncbi:Fic family protein [Duganella guangzhouensis]|uniref:Fic family protein n=1 Tax=Duganella guangzhouensis TaxID=2666084 RepID=UPI00353151EE
MLSFPGPDRSIRLPDFAAGRALSRRYRNRRIGEFLKELELTEGRFTGVPKILKSMLANGSPSPQFETDDDRIAYVIRLPVHPLAQVPEAMSGSLTDQVTDQVTAQVTDQVDADMVRLLRLAALGEQARSALQAALGLRHTPHFRQAYLLPALAAGYLEMTLPALPNSRLQRYRLTAKGRRWLQRHSVKSGA